MSELVSILIPAFNAERWIKDTIQSALDQTWSNIEIIIVDDGSTDASFKIAKSFKSKNIKILTQENQGSSEARNKALKIAQGSYIQWLDHDDLLYPTKISEQLKNIEFDENSRTLLSSSFGRFFYRHQKAIFVENELWQDLSPLDYFLLKFNKNIWLQSAAWLISRSLTNLAGPWCDFKTPDDDGEYFCRVVSVSEKIKFIPEAKSYWRIGNFKSLSHDKSKEALEGLFLSKVKCINYLLRIEDSERTRSASIQFLQDWFGYFYLSEPDILMKLHNFAEYLGGNLHPPEVKSKYFLIKKLLGYKKTFIISKFLQRFKVNLIKLWDYVMYRYF